ncbi:hypothetical protein M413DRAFT_278559 [Hebeloma cylindrosporum]|uniref:Uncharacterized protein n=1 Tax=Hebeloma cylindrosporum TaxID=76867 RepID=A0A0C3C0G6_HEBCY|nr:hypothetical protein M413DRAFT_278559 [Hebeloma cylindrosporum h7]
MRSRCRPGSSPGHTRKFRRACILHRHKRRRYLQYSKEELCTIISYRPISQPIVILVPTKNASGGMNDPALISEFGLEAMIETGQGRVSVLAYSLSSTRFAGCLEAVRWLLSAI